MMTPEQARTLAMSFPQAVEAPHFEATSFRVAKKIFATMGEIDGRLVVKLTADQQAMLAAVQPAVFAAVPGKWGNHGWTTVDLAAVDEASLRHALALSYRNVAPKRLAQALDQS